MTTTDRPAESPTKARYLTEEYEVFKDGRSYMCQKVDYLGEVYEVCRRVVKPGEPVDDVAPQPAIRPGDPGYEELVAYLDQFLTPLDDSSS